VVLAFASRPVGQAGTSELASPFEAAAGTRVVGTPEAGLGTPAVAQPGTQVGSGTRVEVVAVGTEGSHTRVAEAVVGIAVAEVAVGIAAVAVVGCIVVAETHRQVAEEEPAEPQGAQSQVAEPEPEPERAQVPLQQLLVVTPPYVVHSSWLRWSHLANHFHRIRLTCRSHQSAS